MIKMFYHTKTTAVTKAMKWLKSHGAAFEGQDIKKQPLDRETILHMLSLTEEGTDDLISKRSKAYKNLPESIDNMGLNELVDLLQTNPNILKNPIIVDDHKLATGFDLETIREFVPAEYRKKELAGFFKILNGSSKEANAM
ncbi:Spx/MgsR family RNA polymerase-binding regulatory protein [Levilactobacillus bambusae]|uniref:Transcriptional regulator Spx n=1 Tax=Levilactobacillus bambusae TaxID=2024736 RepID=A0A2V1N1A4_9LACO|nr:Spx/MgsR family RNA polymerase-binding regulatory protein [Levilactobacillus bambusae]PWG00156.1 transcriptional regulator Spx [Levilactobacillus bambusae]